MVRRVEINGHYVGDDTVVRVSQFFFLYIAFIVLWALLLTWDGVNIFDAVGISVSTMGCIGPAFGITGATCTYANLSDFAKKHSVLVHAAGPIGNPDPAGHVPAQLLEIQGHVVTI